MTADKFRRLALGLPATVEGAHNGHPDFRVENRIFASLGPDGTWGMVKVPLGVQEELIDAEPEVYRPATGAWGRSGATIVTLKGARVGSVRAALSAAWSHNLSKGVATAFEGERAPGAGQGAARTSKSGGVGNRRGSSNSSPRKREPR